MTCFRTEDGKTARSMCKNQTEYTRFYRAMDKGATVEEALKARTVVINKSHSRSPIIRKLKEVCVGYNDNTYFLIHNYFFRNKTKDIDEAIRWAARTGRLILKKHKRKEYLKL